MVEIQALRLGAAAIAAYPVELFTAYGRRIKAESPFRDTFVASQANGWHGYVPTPEAFARGGYETHLAYQSRLVPEAGELLTEAALGMLARLSASG